MKLVSIIIPAYNMAQYTVLAVESILNQSYKNIEVIVVDDGSSDNTRKLLEPLFNRIKYIYQKNSGACKARNRGFQASNGFYIGFLDCDDMYKKDKVEKYIEKFNSDKELGMVYSPEYLIDGNNNITNIITFKAKKEGNIYNQLLRKNVIGSSTPIIKRTILENSGLWDEHIFTVADWELWIRISKNAKVGFVKEPLSYSRTTSLYNSRNIEKFYSESLYMIKKHSQNYNYLLKRLALSEIYNIIHKYYLENQDYQMAIKFIKKSIIEYPISIKYHVHYLLLLLRKL